MDFFHFFTPEDSGEKKRREESGAAGFRLINLFAKRTRERRMDEAVEAKKGLDNKRFFAVSKGRYAVSMSRARFLRSPLPTRPSKEKGKKPWIDFAALAKESATQAIAEIRLERSVRRSFEPSSTPGVGL